MMELRRQVPKVGGVGAHREMTAEQTWARVRPFLRRAGITRVANITDLDRIGLPVYNAIIPRSNDIISVYNGKGRTDLDAKVSAVMEALERFASWLPVRPDQVDSFDSLKKRGKVALDPATYNIALHPDYSHDRPISWVIGHDLLREVEVLVPMDAAVYSPRFHELPCYQIATTNGLASGNSVEEAICHALCELLERDAITIAELTSGRLSSIVDKGHHAEQASRQQVGYLKSLHPHVRIETVPKDSQEILARFEKAGLQVNILNITCDTGVPSFFVAVADDLGPTVSKGHGGFGTHPDSSIALSRALTECAQGRAVDIQAMREDISLPDAAVPKYLHHTKRSGRIDHTGWAWRATEPIQFSSIESFPSEDICEDIRVMLDRIRNVGISSAVVIDLSPPEMPVSVVRVLVPGLESWAIDQSKIGWRGLGAWKRETARLLRGRASGE